MAKRILCADCKYWQGGGAPEGTCHRHAPRAAVIRESTKRSETVERLNAKTRIYWPVTDAGSFCGEGEPRE